MHIAPPGSGSKPPVTVSQPQGSVAGGKIFDPGSPQSAGSELEGTSSAFLAAGLCRGRVRQCRRRGRFTRYLGSRPKLEQITLVVSPKDRLRAVSNPMENIEKLLARNQLTTQLKLVRESLCHRRQASVANNHATQ